MTPPTVTSMTFDRSPANYTKGDLMRLTVSYLPGTSDTSDAATYTATDNATGLSGTLSIIFNVANSQPDATTGKVTDTGNRTWTPVSDNGQVAVWTAVA
jgi:hypothetical protein